MEEQTTKKKVFCTVAGRNGEVLDHFEIENRIRWTEDGYDVVDWEGNVLSHHTNPKLHCPKLGKGEPIYTDAWGKRITREEFLNDRPEQTS